MVACPKCYLPKGSSPDTVLDSMASQYASGFMGQKEYVHSASEIETEFRAILNRVGVVPKSLTVDASLTGEGILDTTIPRSGDVHLTFNSVVVDHIAPSDLTELLKHEACHVLTLETTEIAIKETDLEMMNYLFQHSKSYDEFLAHREFVKRWPNESAFLRFKTRELNDYAIILNSLRKTLQDGGVPNYHPYSFQALSEIYQDAVYFQLADPQKMRDWCRECNATAVYEFFEFWFEDYQYIAGGSFDRETTMNLAQLSAVLSMSVNVDSLLNKNLILFQAGSDGLYQRFWNKMTKPRERTLIQKWIDRSG
ncbi:MAG: hypothetical protein ACYCPW_07250 [Nitrososphaerales archaeon]